MSWLVGRVGVLLEVLVTFRRLLGEAKGSAEVETEEEVEEEVEVGGRVDRRGRRKGEKTLTRPSTLARLLPVWREGLPDSGKLEVPVVPEPPPLLFWCLAVLCAPARGRRRDGEVS